MDIINFFARIEPVVLYLAGFIFGLFCFFAAKYYKRLGPIKRELEMATAILKAFKCPIDGKKLEELTDQFAELPVFRERWEEFRETLVFVEAPDRSEVVYNTRRPSEFINAESLVEHNLNVYWYQSFPGVLTGLGLIGTFVAILFALGALHVDAGSVGGIDVFINNLSGKFLSSIVGLATAISFLALEKYKLGALNNLCLKIQHSLDRLFPQRVSEAILADMLKHLEEQSNNFRHFSSELSDHLKQGLQESIVPTMDKLAKTIDELLVATEHLQKEKEESTSEVIERIVSTFQSTLTEQAGGEIQQLAGAIDSTAEFVKDMNTRISDSLTQSERMLTNQQQQSAAHLEKVNASVEKMLTSFNDGVANHQEQTESHLQKITDGIDGMLNTVSQSLTLQQEKAQEHAEEMGRIFNGLTKDLEESNRTFVATVKSTIEEMIEKNKEWSNSMSDASSSIQAAATQLETSFKAQKSFLEEVASVGESLTNASKTLLTSTETMSSLQSSSEEGVKQIVAQISHADNVMKELQLLLKRQESLYSTMDQSVGKVLESVNAAMRDYSEHTRESLGTYLTMFDKHLADASNHLHGTVSDLEDNLGALSDMLERTLTARDVA